MDSCKILSRSYKKQGWWMKTFPLSCPPSLGFLRLPYTCSTLRPWREQFYALNVFSFLFLCSWLSNKGSWRRQLLSSQHRTYTTKKNSRIGIFAMDWSVFALLPIWRHCPSWPLYNRPHSFSPPESSLFALNLFQFSYIYVNLGNMFRLLLKRLVYFEEHTR